MNQTSLRATVGRWAVFRWAMCALVAGSLAGCTSTQIDPTQTASNAHTVTEEAGPGGYTAHYRATIDESSEPVTVPPVLLTKDHESLCRVQVGDAMPAIELPSTEGGEAQLSDLYGRGATVVLFWKSDRRMTHTLLADIGPDVIDPFGAAGVEVVGIAVGETARSARDAMREADASFPTLIDTKGEAFAKVGQERLPRVYLLDAEGTVIWFDIEYSLTTRRELHQALVATVGSEQ